MTANVELTTDNVTQITGLTEGTDYLIQAFKKLDNQELIDQKIWLYRGEPTDSTVVGARSNAFRITAGDDDIYVKAISTPTVLTILEC